MSRTKKLDPSHQLTMLDDLLRRDRREEALLTLLIRSLRNADWLMWCAKFTSDLPEGERAQIIEYSKISLVWKMDLMLHLTRYTSKYKDWSLGEIKALITPEDAVLGRTQPLTPDELYQMYVKHDSRTNGLFLAFKDIASAHTDRVLRIKDNFRKATKILKKYDTN